MRRIMILGQPGSGKSTLAQALGVKTGLPVVHIDHIHWQPGWVERSRADKTRMCLAAEAQDTWIFEGGHSATWANRLARADMVIWIDLPFTLRLWRVIKRTLVWQGRSRPDLPAGCVEGFHAETLPFWRFIWHTRHTARDRIARLIASAPAEKSVVHLRSRADVARFQTNWRE